MHNLENIQNEFMQMLISSKKDILPYIKEQGDISVSERFDVHKQTILQNLVNSLKIRYPGVWKLIGEKCAKGVALAYIHEMSNLPVISTLNGFGQDFSGFLSTFESTKELEYLPDFAKLEWLRSLSYHALKNQEIDINCLLEIPQDEIEAIRFGFNSSVFFMKSEFPLEKIQELLVNVELKELSFEEGDSSYIMICRLKDEVATVWLSKQTWIFLSSLNNGDSLGQAIENFMQYGSENEVPKLFQLIGHYKLLSQIKFNHL